MKVVTIIQARTTSSRLPNKALLDIHGKCLLERVIEQAQKIKNSDEVWVATTTHSNDDVIEILCDRINVPCYRGSLEDVRSRFFEIGKNQNADIIVRITADNPLTDPEIAEDLIREAKSNPKYDYFRMKWEKIVDGAHSEVFTFRALKDSISKFISQKDIEHVTPALINKMKMLEMEPINEELVCEKSYFVGIDTFSDYKKVIEIFQKFGEKNTLKHLIKTLNHNG